MPVPDAETGVVSSHIPSVRTLRRLRVALCCAVVLPVVLFAAAAWDERAQSLRAAQTEALASVTTLREHALRTIETDELLLREVDYRLQGLTWDQILASSAAISKEIGSLQTGIPQVSSITVTDAEGRVWAASLPHRSDGSASIRDPAVWSARQLADQSTYVSSAEVDQVTGQRSFDISRRRTTTGDGFDGTVDLTVPAGYFSAFWSKVIGDKDGAVVDLLRIDGDVLARYPVADVSSAQTPRSNRPLGEFGKQPLAAVYRAPSAIDGTDQIVAYARVGTYPLVIGYHRSVYAVLAPWRMHLLVLGGFGAIAVAALALAVVAAMRQVHNLIAEQAHRTAIEAAAQDGQRLEFLGKLAAETAHDFANILQAMRVIATLIRRAADDPERVRSLAKRLDDDAGRGASLIQRMLDLVRPGSGAIADVPDPSAVIDMADTMVRVGDLLRRLLGPRYRLRCEVEPADVPAELRGDQSELELVVMNLAVNARDAMPNGGEVVIQAHQEYVGSAHKPTDLAPGHYVRLSVSDTGSGMTPDVLARAGELFFTTKPRGRGTGLGLVGARGFARRAGGRLTIKTEIGRGTIVTLWLPVVAPNPVVKLALTQPAG